MKSENPILQKILNDLQERNRRAQEWRDNFAEKILNEVKSGENGARKNF